MCGWRSIWGKWIYRSFVVSVSVVLSEAKHLWTWRAAGNGLLLDGEYGVHSRLALHLLGKQLEFGLFLAHRGGLNLHGLQSAPPHLRDGRSIAGVNQLAKLRTEALRHLLGNRSRLHQRRPARFSL